MAEILVPVLLLYSFLHTMCNTIGQFTYFGVNCVHHDQGHCQHFTKPFKFTPIFRYVTQGSHFLPTFELTDDHCYSRCQAKPIWCMYHQHDFEIRSAASLICTVEITARQATVCGCPGTVFHFRYSLDDVIALVRCIASVQLAFCSL